MSAELRKEWACTECTVRCFKATGEPFPAPTGWDETADRCLSCAKRNEDAEGTEDRARRMVLEGRKTNEIARSCKGTTKKLINEMRDQAIEAGELDAAKVERSQSTDPNCIADKDRAKVPAVEEALRADPSKPNTSLADELGVNTKTVAITRKRLSLPTSQQAGKERRGEQIRQALSEHPDLTDAQLGELLGLSAVTVGAARRKLGVPPKQPGPKPGFGGLSTVGSD